VGAAFPIVIAAGSGYQDIKKAGGLWKVKNTIMNPWGQLHIASMRW
jgi:hypothetical protein